MSYADITQMVTAFGIAEAARLCGTDQAPYLIADDTQLFSDAINGVDLAGEGYSEDQQDAAENAIARGETALADASGEIDSRLACRYATPIADEEADTNGLPRRCLQSARYLLADDHAIDEVKDRYEKAIAWLDKVASGKACLVDVEPIGSGGTDVPGIGDVRFGQGDSQYDWSGYR